MNDIDQCLQHLDLQRLQVRLPINNQPVLAAAANGEEGKVGKNQQVGQRMKHIDVH
jgi:hypothetical protein